jgi:LacI family transcriptional regulator, repressor for deo operon, udp, cdd, tsx, nupC, and nupG
MPNIYDVARRAGVSPSTVSRVLSRPDMVSVATRARVTRAVEQLAFIPNSTAKNLRRASTRKLLVTVPDISNPFFSLILQGIEDTAQRHHYSVLVGDTQNDQCREERYALMLQSKEADGLIFLGHRLPEAAAALARAAAPNCAPIVNGCEFNPRLGVPSVHIDNARAASDVVHLLHDLGHRRIGVVTGPLGSPLSRDRLRGATTTARRRGGGELIVVNGDFSVVSGIEAARQFFGNGKPPTAVFCFNDEMAMGVLELAREKRLRVPKDLSVVGFDDIRFAQYTQPSLTTISQPMRAIGEGTVKLLLSIIEDPSVTPDSVTLPHSLVARGSTSTAPSRR